MKFLLLIFFIYSAQPLKGEISQKEINALISSYKIFSQQKKEPYYPSGAYTFLDLIPKDKLKNIDLNDNINFSGDEIPTLINMTKRLNLGSTSSKNYALQVAYNLCFLNTLVNQVEHFDISSFFAKLYFECEEKPLFNGENVYLKRNIQSNINSYLREKYKLGESSKDQFELLKINRLLDYEDIASKLTYLLYRYGLPIIEENDSNKEVQSNYFKKLIIDLRNSQNIEENRLSYLLNKAITKDKKLKYDEQLINSSQKLLDSIRFKNELNLPLLKPRFINCLAVDEKNNGHVIRLNGSVKVLTDKTVIKAANNEAKEIAASGNQLLEVFEEFKSGLLFEIKTPERASLKGSSADLALSLLLNSFTADKILSHEVAFTGALNGKQVSYVRGLRAKISGGLNSGIKFIGLPLQNIEEINDFCLLNGYDHLKEIQLIGLKDFQSALDFCENLDSYDFKKAGDSEESLSISRLKEFLKKKPNHLSASLLLAKALNQHKKRLSFGTSVEQIRYLTQALLTKEAARETLENIIKSLKELSLIIDLNCIDFLNDMQAYLRARADKKNLPELRSILIKSGREIDKKLQDYYEEKAILK